MRKGRCTKKQIIGISKEHEAGAKSANLCREPRISAATFCGWESKFGGMEAEVSGAAAQGSEGENRPLKLLLAELSPQGEALKEVIRNSGWSLLARENKAAAPNVRPHSPH